VLAKRISPAARVRRAWLADVVVAVFLAALAWALAPGLGVIGFFGVPALSLLLLSFAVERRLARRRSAERRALARLSRQRASDGVSPT
jgi:predicted lysophospholipase L1 biosynthesis ABC-type transport system permease subunit